MKPRQPRVPVRWGVVLPVGLIVAAIVSAAAWYGMGAAAKDPDYQKHTIESLKRVFGN